MKPLDVLIKNLGIQEYEFTERRVETSDFSTDVRHYQEIHYYSASGTPYHAWLATDENGGWRVCTMPEAKSLNNMFSHRRI